MRELSDGVIWPNFVPDPAADDYETIPDTDSTENTDNMPKRPARPALQELGIRVWVRWVRLLVPATLMAT